MTTQPHLSKDTVIPSALWLDSRIEPSAVKLYAIIRGLSDKYGYCYASNEYLAESINYKLTQLKKFLTLLKGCGYIEIETKKAGVIWDRRIYISDKFNKCLRRSVERPSKVGGATYIRIRNNKNKEYKERERSAPPPMPPLPSLFEFKAVKMLKKDYDDLIEKHGQEVINEYIENLELYSRTHAKAFKVYTDHAAVIETWIRRDKKKKDVESPVFNEKDHHSLAETVVSYFQEPVKKGHIELKKEGLLFSYGRKYELIDFKDIEFREKVMCELSFMNLTLE